MNPVVIAVTAWDRPRFYRSAALFKKAAALDIRMKWEQKLVDPERILKKIRPGMRIFLGTGVSEPRTLTEQLMSSQHAGLADLELIQLVNLSGSISLKSLNANKFRLKTFYSGAQIDKAIVEGQVDLIPCRFGNIHRLFRSGRIHLDAAFIQVSVPDESGKCSLGVSLDVARQAMDQADLVVGEINPLTPRCFGDTFVHTDAFDFLVRSDHDLIYLEGWAVTPVFESIARKIARLIQNKSCLAFSIGPLFEALSDALGRKKHLGVHSPVFTDALMRLIRTGAVTNLYKKVFPGHSVASYAFGSPELMDWLSHNHRVQFQETKTVFDPIRIGENPRAVTILPARKMDLYGRIAFHKGKGNVVEGPMELIDFFWGAKLSKGGRTFIGIPSRNRAGAPNIKLSIERFSHQFGLEQAVDMVVTEHGIAMLDGLSIRERALAIIEIAHPDDRNHLLEQAKEKKLIYPDQIFIHANHYLYPVHIFKQHTFKTGETLRFRPIRPSDEDQMRRLFYRFSEEAIYCRYFHCLSTMPHSRMQAYVNVNWNDTMSIVGLAGEPGRGKIVAEARYLTELAGTRAEIAFIVDEAYGGLGIATYLFTLLRQIALKQGITAFTADVLSSNIAMMKVFKKVSPSIQIQRKQGIFHVVMPIRT